MIKKYHGKEFGVFDPECAKCRAEYGGVMPNEPEDTLKKRIKDLDNIRITQIEMIEARDRAIKELIAKVEENRKKVRTLIKAFSMVGDFVADEDKEPEDET
jgi:uncharacterized coiled-coil protein SlyX